MAPSDIIAYTDGSKKENTAAAFGIVLYDHEGNTLREESGKLSKGKTILDAEITAIYNSMELAMETKDHTTVYERDRNRNFRKVVILSDSLAALELVENPRQSGPAAYTNLHRHDIETHPQRPNTAFFLHWVKGHSRNKGNDRADALARTADVTKDPRPGKSYTSLTEDLTNKRNELWNEWFNLREHHYKLPPNVRLTRKLKRHRGMSRLDSITLFKLKSNKGWRPDDIIGIFPPPDCPTCPGQQDDGKHKFSCPRWEKERPPENSIISVIPRPSVMNWIRHHEHFGMTCNLYEVNYINLRIGNTDRTRDIPCPHCEYITRKQNNLDRHMIIHTRGII